MRHSGLPLAASGSRANNTPCQARCAQNADHLAHNSPFSPFFTEVVCTLGTTPARTATSPPPNARNFATRGSDTSATHRQRAWRGENPGYRTCRVAGFVPCMPWYALLVRTWACYSESGQPRPRTEQRVNVRNRRPTCETAGSHAGRVGTQVTVAHSQSMTDHGAATHRPAMQHSQERGKHHHLQQQLSHATKPKSHPASNTICPSSTLAPPPTTPTFPRQQAEKSPQNQHVLSCNPKTPPAPVRRLPESQAAMPVGGGRAWPDNEPTRRAKLAARTASGRAATHGHTKQPGRDSGRVQSPARAPAATCARSSGHPDPPHARPRTQPGPRT